MKEEFMGLPGFKEEYLEILADMNIESLADLKETLEDDDAVKDVMSVLKGVGPKTIEKWRATLADMEILDEEEVEIVEEEETEEREHVANLKPEFDEFIREKLAIRDAVSSRRPAFKRQEWFRYSRLGEKWRRPKGIHSKMRRSFKYRPPMVNIGYRGPKEARGLHPSGFAEVMVHNVNELDGVDPKVQAIRIAGTVGVKKRIDIEDKADELGIRVLNRMG